MKTILFSLFIAALFAFNPLNAIAGSSHLKEAIEHTEAATKANDAKAITQHAEEAKTHANAAKSEMSENKHLQEGLKSLDEAAQKGRDGKAEEARKAAKDALEHFNQTTK